MLYFTSHHLAILHVSNRNLNHSLKIPSNHVQPHAYLFLFTHMYWTIQLANEIFEYVNASQIQTPT
jgi:hypothetical protein